MLPQKSVSEAADTQTALPVWTEDEAGPFPTMPYPGQHGRAPTARPDATPTTSCGLAPPSN